MRSSVVAEEKKLRAWLNNRLSEAQANAQTLLARPSAEWPGWLAAHRDILDYAFANAILDAAVGARDRDPAEAVKLTSLVVDYLGAFHSELPVAAMLMETRAWLERGNALQAADDLAGALDAFTRALEIAASSPLLELQAAMARRGAAYVRHRMGVSDEPLRTIRADIPLFESRSSLGDVLRSRFYEGAIEYDLGHYAAAMRVFENAATIASELADDRMLARLYNNLGHCARNLGRRDEAVRYLLDAMRLLELHGMYGEPFRAQWGVELLRADDDAATEAVARLRSMMGTLIERGRTIEAALVALDIAEVLVMSERHDHVRRLASDLVTIFDTAKMPRETLRAFSALRAAAAERPLSTRDVRAAIAEIHALR